MIVKDILGLGLGLGLESEGQRQAKNLPLRLRNICKSYADLPVLQGIDLLVPPHSQCVILGESGSGKSTLLNLISTLDDPDTGSIIYGKDDVTRLRKQQQQRYRAQVIGYLHQRHYLLPELNVLENSMISALLSYVPRSQAENRSRRLLQTVGLGDRLRHVPHQLSVGEKARLALVVALAANKPIVLADEPTGNLDEENAQKIFDLILDLQKKYAFSLIMVSHNHRLVQSIPTKYYLRDGKLQLLAGRTRSRTRSRK